MSETAFILIVEDHAEHAEALADSLRERGNLCTVVQNADDALASIRTRKPDVIVAGDALAGASNGLELLRQSKRLAPDAEVVLLASDEEGKEAVPDSDAPALFKRLVMPVESEVIDRVVSDAVEQAVRNRQRRALREQADRSVEFEGIITANEQMIRIIKVIRRVADSKVRVLVLGDSGTGKELVARAIHRHSPRARRPYHAINCAGLNENLLESELFGHVKGAFTSAVADRKGWFEVADGGTLFLDEVGDMPIPMQAKLLRTLESGEIIPVGSSEVRKVDVRVIAATRRDIRSMLETGEFRDDLFYRLNQAMIRIPPLRDRREDIPLLIEHFLADANVEHGKHVESVSSDVVRRLTSYSWPGNVRELRSVIEQMVVLAEGRQLELDDLPESLRGSTDIVLASGPSTAGLTMEQMERIHIANTLQLTGGNREKTAKMLGIGARTLYRKLREYGL